MNKFLGIKNNNKQLKFKSNFNGELSDKFVIWQPANRENNESIKKDNEISFLSRNSNNEEIIEFTIFPDEFINKAKSLNDYNKYYFVNESKLQPSYDNSLLVNINSKDNIENDLNIINEAFIKADNTAIFSQKSSNKNFKLFAIMAGLMGLFFLIYAKVVAHKIFIILYVLLFVTGFIYFKLNKKQNWLKRHLTSRIIAETLRIKYYLTQASVTDKLSFKRLFKLSGIHNFPEFCWVNWIIKPTNFSSINQIPTKKDISNITKEWVKKQADYFANKSSMLRLQHHKLEKINNIILLLSLFSALALIFFKLNLSNTIIAYDFSSKSLLVFLMGLLPFMLGVWEIYNGKMAIKELSWQYKNQAKIFNKAYNDLSQVDDVTSTQNILLELAECSLMENYIWSIQRYHRFARLSRLSLCTGELTTLQRPQSIHIDG